MDSENIQKHIPHGLAALTATYLLYRVYKSTQTEYIMGHGDPIQGIVETIDGVDVQQMVQIDAAVEMKTTEAMEANHLLRYLTYS